MAALRKEIVGNINQNHLADIYKIGQDQISRIVNYKRWKNLSKIN